MSLRFVAPLRTLARRAAAHRWLVLGIAAATFTVVLAGVFLIESRARAADGQNFHTGNGGLAAFIDADGNLSLRGSVQVVVDQPIVPSADAWVVRTPDGVVQAALDLSEDANGQPLGTLYVRQNVVPNTDSSYLDAFVPDSMMWVHYLTPNHILPPWTLRDSTGRVLAVLAYNGATCQLYLRGQCYANSQDATLAPPTGLIARPLVEAVRLDFTPPTSEKVTGYQVQISPPDNPNSFSVVPPQNVTWLGNPPCTSCMCTGLLGGHTYYFRVSSIAGGFVGTTPSNVASAVPFTQCQQPWPGGWK